MSSHAPGRVRLSVSAALACAYLFGPSAASAQTGVDDDRVSLPEGPGSIEGVGENVEIDPNMGSMRFSVPISVPGGINGFGPQVGLNYSSAAGSSVVGVGWSMPTMTIERTTSRRTPNYDLEDYFASNGGDELVLVDDGQTNRVYRERFEGSFVRYTWRDIGGGDEGYWTAEYPDGSVGYFGATADGTLVDSARSTKPGGGVYKYHMVEKVDPFGHVIQYDYETFGGNWPLVSKIGYVFQGDAPLYEVTFAYETRDDRISDAGAGYEELLGHRLTGVQVLAAGDVVREYALTYQDYDDAGGFTRLERVERYGVGGVATGLKYPVTFGFDYSRALGAGCQVGCDGASPYLVDMGTVSGASNITDGKATLVDLNADGLPDILNTAQPDAHQILFNAFDVSVGEGGPVVDAHGFGSPGSSSIGTGTGFGLGDAVVQIADVNGDGLSDMFNSLSGSTLLAGYGQTDWSGNGAALDVSALAAVDMSQARFTDYNNDKRIDVITSTTNNTVVYENTGDGFVARTVSPLGVALGNNPSVQFADMNGDGYSDVVELLGDGTIRYRLNYGWGNWSSWRSITTLTIPLAERELVDLEDLNGDGLDDVVVVNPSEVKYAINRNGDSFDAFVSIRSADIDGDLPERGMNDRVLYADMNANGSEDIVWFGAAGEVEYLELFPVRPNLLSRITNGLGSVQLIAYTTAAEQQALARAEGDPWTSSLSIPMNVVAEVDTFVTLTGAEDGSGLHDVTTYRYRDGFYDGVEKQFRGFETVEVTTVASDSQEGGVTTMLYSVGRDSPHMNGQLLSESISSGGRLLREQSMSYGDCDIAGVPSPADLVALGRFGVYFPCQTDSESVIIEGLERSQAVTTRTESVYDAWGNVTLTRNLGVADVTGDEAFAEVEFWTPGAGDPWFLRLPTVERSWSVEGGAVKTETRTYYDGDDFVGSATEVTHGFPSRVTIKVDDATTIDTLRARRDAHGNVVETIDPNGSLEDADANRRRYYYDDTGLFLTYLDVHVQAGHVLRRTTQYEQRFGRLTDVTDWVVILDGEAASPANDRLFVYDDFGRLSQSFEPGDASDAPSSELTYELADPASRVVTTMRRSRDSEVLDVAFDCFDGKGRKFQRRTQLEGGEYLVTGFSTLNSRGAEVEVFQPFTSESGDCDTERPGGVLSTLQTYDTTFRVIERSEPGEDLFGERLVSRTAYEPLRRLEYDFADLDPSSPHFDTPTTTHTDGLGRVTALERLLADATSASYTLHYDETGSFSGYTDPGGNRHEQVVDLAGRVTRVTDPNTGEIAYTYDASGKVLTSTDARGVTTSYAYDGANRLIETWDASDRDASLISYHYDTLPEGCALTECTNTANRLGMITYPTPFGQASDRLGYDARQRVVFQGRRFGAALDLTTTTAYDNLGRVTRVDYSDGTSMETTYDASGRPASVPGFVDAIGFSERGLPSQIRYANGAVSDRAYDALARLESQINAGADGEIIDGFVMTRDRVGNVLSIDDMNEQADGLAHDASFAYDAWYRVTESNQKLGGADEQLSYDFDVLDRVTSIDSTLAQESAAHVGAMGYDDARPLALAKAGALELGYDAAGQMTSRGEMTLTWDFMSRITSAARAGLTQTHVYGADKARVAVIGDDDVTFYGFNDYEVRDGVSSVYVRPLGERLAKSIGTGLLTQLFTDGDADGELTAADVWSAGSPAAPLTRGHAFGAVAARMLADARGEKVFFHHDFNTSIVSATDEAGAVVGRRSYSPTGVVREQHGHVDVYGFTEQEHNAFTGLIQFRMRDLDPLTGRWASFDPGFVKLDPAAMSAVGEATTGYAYVGNNFTNEVDPLGLTSEGGKEKVAGARRDANAAKGSRSPRAKADGSFGEGESAKSREKQVLSEASLGKAVVSFKITQAMKGENEGTRDTGPSPGSLSSLSRNLSAERGSSLASLSGKLNNQQLKSEGVQQRREKNQRVRQNKRKAKLGGIAVGAFALAYTGVIVGFTEGPAIADAIKAAFDDI